MPRLKDSLVQLRPYHSGEAGVEHLSDAQLGDAVASTDSLQPVNNVLIGPAWPSDTKREAVSTARPEGTGAYALRVEATLVDAQGSPEESVARDIGAITIADLWIRHRSE